MGKILNEILKLKTCLFKTTEHWIFNNQGLKERRKKLLLNRLNIGFQSTPSSKPLRPSMILKIFPYAESDAVLSESRSNLGEGIIKTPFVLAWSLIINSSKWKEVTFIFIKNMIYLYILFTYTKKGRRNRIISSTVTNNKTK